MLIASRLFKNLKLKTPGLHVKWIHPKAKFKLKEEIERMIETKEMNPRKHPGILKRNMVRLPEWTVEAMNQSLDDVEKYQIYKESKQLSNYLYSRRLPPEGEEIKKKTHKIESDILGQDIDSLTPEDLEIKRKKIKQKVKSRLITEVFAWKALEYNKYKSLLYMVSRSAAEYAVLHSIFQEIKSRDPEFVPKTIFDFGSGVGSVLWAALTHWPKGINEYVGIDISSDMHDISDAIMKHSPIKVKGVFLRQYMPVSNLKHDMIISAYSLIEMYDMRNRLEIIAKLWKKTNKYLILVEQGSNAGFQVMNEARSFIKHVMDNIETSYDYFIFAPCPHENPCPRYAEEKKTPCNFVVSNATLPLLGPSSPHQELYTYIVFKKGKRTENDNWHRLVRPTIVSSRHVRSRTCTPDGKLEEIVFTATKYGRSCYRCARKSRWGDRLPIDPVQHDNENVNIEASEIDGPSESDEESENENSEYEDDLEIKKIDNEFKNAELKNEENSCSEKIIETKNDEQVVVSKSPFEKS